MKFSREPPQFLIPHSSFRIPYAPACFLAVLMALNLAACGTLGGASLNPDEASYNIFFSPSDHIKALTARGDLENASRVYEKQRDWFRREDVSAKEGAVVNQLAKALTRRYRPTAAAAKADLDSIQWPAEPDQWQGIKEKTREAAKIVEQIEGHSILMEPKYRIAVHDELKEALHGLEARMRQSAPDQFAAYPLGTAPDFFETYPVALNAEDFLRDHAGSVKAYLKGASAEQASHIFKTYVAGIRYRQKPFLEDLKKELARRYYAASLDVGARDANMRDFSSIVKAAEAARDSGLPLNEIPGASVCVIDVTDKNPRDGGRRAFPVSITGDLPCKTERASLDNALTSENSQRADIVLLLDKAAARVNRETVSDKKVNSEFRSGTRSVPNPDYNMAQNEVNIADSEVRNAVTNLSSVNSQYCEGAGCIFKAVAQVSATGVVTKARQRLNAAMEKLRNTPMTLEKPVYTPYQFSKKTIKVTREARIHAYLVDRISNQYIRDTFKVHQSKQFVVAGDVHEKDRDRQSRLAGTGREEDISAFEKEEVAVKLSAILDRLSENKSLAAPLPAMTQIRADIYADKNRAVAALRPAPRYKPLPAGGDVPVARVAMKSTGTGFILNANGFIITNFHVVRGAKSIRIKTPSGGRVPARLALKDEANDIAVLRADSLPGGVGSSLYFGDSGKSREGDKVFTIGYPFSNILGEKPRYSEGIINSLYGVGDDPRFFQISVPIQPGNSGAPLFNKKGEVIGIVVASLDARNVMEITGAIPQNINFAVKATYIKNLVAMLPNLGSAMVMPTDLSLVKQGSKTFVEATKNNIVLIESER